MNLELFIIKKVAFSKKASYSKLIIKIAVAAVALGTTVMIVSAALISGFKKEISSKIFGFEGHVLITDYESTQSLEPVPIKSNQDFLSYLDSVDQFTYLEEDNFLGMDSEAELVQKKTIGGIKHIQVYAEQAGIIDTKKELEALVLRGVGSDYDWSFLSKCLVDGEIIPWTDSIASKEILISNQTSKRLDLEVGDAFLVYFVKNAKSIKRRFKVGGIYNTGLAEKDERYAFVDIRHIQKLNKWEEDEVMGFEVFIENIEDLDPLTEKIYDVVPMNMYVQSIRNKDASIFDWLELQNVNERVIMILMIIVCIINMITALLILILERTNMIGILKSLGSQNWSIQKLFLYYGAFITLVGLFLGDLIGIGICLAQKYGQFIKLPEEDYYVSVAPIELDFSVVIILNLIVLFLTVIIMIIPSFLVRYISPVKAIGFK